MDWIEITIATTEQGLSAVCGRLDMLGITNVTVEQGAAGIEAFLQRDAKYWDYADVNELVHSDTPCVKAYTAADDAETVALIRHSFEELKEQDVGLDLGSLAVSVQTVADEDWANNWKAYYKPIEIGKKLLICPTWESVEQSGRIAINMDPGMAFGTGSHHTTRLCLEFLEKYACSCKELLDIGCGSGILSIAGLLLGAEHATGVDIDPLSPDIARQNAALNGITEDVYTLYTGDIISDEALYARLASKKYNVICSNIAANVIVMLAPLYKDLLADDGVVIASGIIDERRDEVVAELNANGLYAADSGRGEDWNALLLRAK